MRMPSWARLSAVFALVFFGASAAEAANRVLPRTLVISQCQFYPLREQERGYLGRYVDQPLFIDPDLPLDGDVSDGSYLKTWNNFYSMADLEGTQRLAKDAGLDGLSFFSLNWRDYMWTAIERSRVKGCMMIPNIHLPENPMSAYSLESFGKAIRSTAGLDWNGRKVIVSYWTENRNPPERLAEKLGAARKKFGDGFAYVPDLTSLCRNGEYREDGSLPDEILERNRDTIRRYLRVSDGIHVGATFNLQREEKGRRVFNAPVYRTVVKTICDVATEPEFAGRKLIVLSALVSHENPTSQYHTPEQDGLRTLAQSMEIACEAEPDMIVLPEWDEWNENTCFCPTLCNGIAVKRVMRPFLAKLRGERLSPIDGDDTSVPNLIVSARKCVSPGGKFFVNVRNAPDGARSGNVMVSVELFGEAGQKVASFREKALDESASCDVRFYAASEDLATKARALWIRLSWRKGEARGSFEGFHPVEISPGNAWCVKEVHQAVRDLAPLTKCDVAFSGGRVSGVFASDEPLRYAMTMCDGRIQRIFGRPGDVRDRFTENATHAVFKVSPYAHDYSAFSRPKVANALTVIGAEDVEWLDALGATRSASHKCSALTPVSQPLFVRIPKSSLGTARVEASFPGSITGSIPLAAAFRCGAYILPGEHGASLTAARLRIQSRYPSVAASKSVAFDAAMVADRPTLSFFAQAVTMAGHIWRSRPFVREADVKGMAAMQVYSCEKGKMVDIELPAVRVPRVEYDFSPDAGSYLPAKGGWRRFSGALGGIHSQANLYNRSGSGMFDRPEALRTLPVVDSPVPSRERRADGSWALVFDGVDDYAAFPWELLPQTTGYRLSFEIRPARDDCVETLFATKTVMGMRLDRGELKFDVAGGREHATGIRLSPGKWHRVSFASDGEKASVTVDGGPKYEASVTIPGICMSSVSFGGSDRKDRRCFKGALASLVVDHAMARKHGD